MQLQDILYSQGFGTRRVCAGLIQQGLVQVYASVQAPATVCTESNAEFVADGLRFRVQGVDWPYPGREITKPRQRAAALSCCGKSFHMASEPRPSCRNTRVGLWPPEAIRRYSRLRPRTVTKAAGLDVDIDGAIPL